MRLIFANRLEKRRKYGYFILQWFGPGGGMADAADLKSAFRNEVRVRSPSRVPLELLPKRTGAAGEEHG